MGSRYFWWQGMTNEKILQTYIRNVCLEIKYDYSLYRALCDEFLSQTEEMSNGRVGNIPSLSGNASKIYAMFAKYTGRKRDMMRFCDVLGDKYNKIYEEILGDI